MPDAGRLGARVVAALLRRAALRGVIQRGRGGHAADGDHMPTVGEVPHSPLFRWTAAVVHHAGAGTTAAGLRAGCLPCRCRSGSTQVSGPPGVAPGVAPAAVSLRRLTVDAPAAALVRGTRDPAYRRRAAAPGARVRGGDGATPVPATVARLDSWTADRGSPE